MLSIPAWGDDVVARRIAWLISGTGAEHHVVVRRDRRPTAGRLLLGPHRQQPVPCCRLRHVHSGDHPTPLCPPRYRAAILPGRPAAPRPARRSIGMVVSSQKIGRKGYANSTNRDAHRITYRGAADRRLWRSRVYGNHDGGTADGHYRDGRRADGYYRDGRRADGYYRDGCSAHGYYRDGRRADGHYRDGCSAHGHHGSRGWRSGR